MRPWSAAAALLFAASASLATAQRPPRPNVTPAQDPLRFQFLGPVAGGRISAVAGVVGDPKTWYMGAASGGVWKSSDSGSTYVPVFDAQPVQAIGSLAVSASNPSVVWAGTGEAWAIRDADVMGDGVYKSTDAGAKWTNVGLRDVGRIGRIILHPTNADIAYVCALGRATGPQQDRGVYRTTDGGKTWQRVLFVDPNTGCSGLAIDANDPNVLIAGMWEVVMHTWIMKSGGPGSGVYLTKDGGATWSHLENGLPKSPVGKIDVAVAPSNSKRMFALIQTATQGSLWRSDDAGASWKTVSWDRTLIGRAGYYIRIEVNPKNENEVLIANSTFHRSTDGGLTFPLSDRGCGDCHDIWMDPKNGDHWATTGDAGAGITWNHARTFTNITLPIGQMYHVAVDEQVPYYVYSNRQDNGTMRGPSSAPEAGQSSVRQQRPGQRGGAARGDSAGRSPDSTGGARPGAQPPVTSPGDSAARRAAATDTAGAGGDNAGGFFGGGGSTWDHGLGGCESGFTIPDRSDPDIVWSSCYGNQVTRWDAKTKRARSVAPWIHTLDSPPNELKYRCHWTPPLAVDPFDPKTVYYGCQVIFKTSNAGQTWAVTSPDLSTRDTSRIAFSGGIVGDNLGQFYGEVVFSIAPSPIRRGLIWAGTNDGQIWNTRDGGATWTNVTKNVSGLPTWGTIRQIAPSNFDAGTAYVTVDFHMMDNREPFLYKTTDYGRTWAKITGDLPTGHPLSYVMSVAENPNKRGMLFAGTGNGFYYSRDDGAHWTQIKAGLPASPVTWIVAPKARWHDVVVSTYGRGIYVLRDVTALEMGATPSVVAENEGDGGGTEPNAAPARTADAVRLYPPRAGYREARSGYADFTFSVPTKSAEPAKLEIMDSTGVVIRTLNVGTRAGLNRVVWDLRYEAATRVDLRTTPPDNAHIWDEPRFKGKQVRPIVHWGIDGPLNSGPLALPGRYSARLTTNGTTTTPERFTVTRATETTMPIADLVASMRAQLRVRDAMNATASLINRIETMRKQLEDQRKKSATDAEAVAAVDAMDNKLLDVELKLLSRTDLHSDDKWYVESYKIYMNLVWLSGEIGTGAGDVAGGAEFRPTDASLAVLAMLEKQLAEAKAAYDRVMKDDVAAFNKAMSGKMPALVF
jgi:photosystem II stability/assembly factor-like uncharacterized protein